MTKIHLASLFGIILLGGAGCEALPQELQNSTDTAVETAAPAETAAESTTENKKTETALTGSAAITVKTDPKTKTTAAKKVAAPAPTQPTEPESTVTTVEENSDQEMIQLFEFKPTHERNYSAYRLWDRYANRASLATVLASPAGTEKYQQTEWCPLDQPCLTMANAGLAANLAMKKADEAFKAGQTNTEQMVSAAINAVAKYFQTILTFEATWGVKGE